MKKKLLFRKMSLLLLTAMTSVMMVACGNSGESVSGNEVESIDISELNLGGNSNSSSDASSDSDTYVEEVAPEGCYRSELTGEWISEDIKNQRPIAVMVDNELTALPHYGLNNADIVYEIMNSTLNNRITRFMVIYKDWANIEQLGSIRSARPTNFMLAADYNAILVHDGGPFYIDQYVARDYTDNLSGGFARFSNGKSTEFTEYVTYEDYHNPTTGRDYDGLGDRIEAAGYSTDYNEYYAGDHFNFVPSGVDLEQYNGCMDATTIELNFPHNDSTLYYNPETKLYEYYEYGSPHVDPLDDNNVLTFKNIIIQNCTFSQLDSNGYLIYNCLGTGDGYYITEGKCIPIAWGKLSETVYTSYLNAQTGEPIEMNVGKTYIAVIPSDTANQLVIE